MNRIAKMLLDIEAVALRPDNPFTLSSGLLSPVYCDNRLTLAYPSVRRAIAEGLAETIESCFGGTELIAGTATAGIPHAAWVSERLDLPMCYVRSKAKGHGKGKLIEGKALPGQKAVVVEDLISTAGSAVSAAEALRAEGIEVLGIVSIVTYDMEVGRKRLRKADIESHSLAAFSDLLEAAAHAGLVNQAERLILENWQGDPEKWGLERASAVK